MQSKLLINELETNYLSDPTSQPTAFWKYAAWTESPDMNISERNGIYSFVLGDSLVYRYPLDCGTLPEIDNQLSTLVFASQQTMDMSWTESKFFKLYHNHEAINPADLSDDFEFMDVAADELNEVSQFINDNYVNIKVNIENVQSWTASRVYNQQLWIWIIHKTSKEKVALGIADLDEIRGEGSLEWIQVDSGFRGYGLGKALVNELLNRIALSGKFTSVSGEVDNVTQPERLYRACGFVGERIWHIYKRVT